MENIEKYTIKSYGFSIKIEINGIKKKAIDYKVNIPEFSIPTLALLDTIKTRAITQISLTSSEILNSQGLGEVKKRFEEQVASVLKEELPNVDQNEAVKNILIGKLMNDMIGLGDIEFLLLDESLEEIVINSSKEPIRVYHKRHGWLVTNITIEKETQINNYAEIIARRVGRQITSLDPLLDAHLITGDRANAVLYPIATKGNTITIRKFARDPWTIIDLIDNQTVSLDVAIILWLAIEYEMNILISGGTASGKTVFLNACMPFVPPNHRIISMEDTRELMLPEFLYWCPLVTRSPNPEGKGEVSMLDLLVNSLRMRPDRIILGEIRRQREAEVLFEAMHTGHSVYATVHADTANETIRRLINPPINISPSMLNNVNLNVVMFRDRRSGKRRVYQLAEFLPGKEIITANILYRWVPEKDEIVAHNESMAFFDELSRHTGMSQADINKNLAYKQSILIWLLKNKVRNLNSIGKVMNLYYTNPELLASMIKKNEIAKVIVKEGHSSKEEKAQNEA